MFTKFIRFALGMSFMFAGGIGGQDVKLIKSMTVRGKCFAGNKKNEAIKAIREDDKNLVDLEEAKKKPGEYICIVESDGQYYLKRFNVGPRGELIQIVTYEKLTYYNIGLTAEMMVRGKCFKGRDLKEAERSIMDDSIELISLDQAIEQAKAQNNHIECTCVVERYGIYYLTRFDVMPNGNLIQVGINLKLDWKFLDKIHCTDTIELDELQYNTMYGKCLAINTNNLETALNEFISEVADGGRNLVPINSKLRDGRYVCLLEYKALDRVRIFRQLCIFDTKNNRFYGKTISCQKIQVQDPAGLLKNLRQSNENYKAILPYLEREDKDALAQLRPGERISLQIRVPQLYTRSIEGRKIFEPPIDATHVLDLDLVRTPYGVINYQYHNNVIYIAMPYFDDKVTFIYGTILSPRTRIGNIQIQSRNNQNEWNYSMMDDRMYSNSIYHSKYKGKEILTLYNMNANVPGSSVPLLNNEVIGLPYIDRQDRIFFYHDPDSLLRDHGDDLEESKYRVGFLFKLIYVVGPNDLVVRNNHLENLMPIVPDQYATISPRILPSAGGRTLSEEAPPETVGLPEISSRTTPYTRATFPTGEGRKLPEDGPAMPYPELKAFTGGPSRLAT